MVQRPSLLNSIAYWNFPYRMGRKKVTAINLVLNTADFISVCQRAEDLRDALRGRLERTLMRVRKQHRLAWLTSFSGSFPHVLWIFLIGFFFFFFSFVDETFQKLILPINTRKLYLELKTFYRWANLKKKKPTHKAFVMFPSSDFSIILEILS